ncbi:hypothetical protein N7451_010555 [Penicillium sp. IBT 35674x]|nr:hypothetical protein N7451_010555 [Penicillium sp. IBT 35674x]
MPHKVTNDSNSTLASNGSSGDQVIATEVRDASSNRQCRPQTPGCRTQQRGPNIRRNKAIGLGQTTLEVVLAAPAASNSSSSSSNQQQQAGWGGKH